MKIINKKKRSFLNMLLMNAVFVYIGSILVVILSHITPRKKKNTVLEPLNLGKITALESNPKFDKKSQSLIFSFNETPSILIKINQDEYKAFNAVCTHLGCVISFKKDKNVFYCNCHGGTYDLTGKNIAGPPPRPLQNYDVINQEGDLIIKPVVITKEE